ncbi:MAG: hypothetical protein ACKOXP_05565 [Flavobacteriales bacterium]
MNAYIDIFEKDYMESRSEVKRSLVYTSISLLILFILLVITQFNILPAIPEDIPPLKSDEVIELFEMEHVELIPEESGSRGGGTSSDAPIDQPQDQTERIATSHSSDFTSASGQSNNHNTNNSNNPTSTTVRGTNYFGSGGNGGETGSGNGPFGGSGSGPDDGNGPGRGTGSGKARVRLNNVNLPQYDIDVDCRVGLKITINSDGVITDCRSIKSVTTCTSQSIINDVINRVKQQVKFNKDQGAPLAQVDYTIGLKAR